MKKICLAIIIALLLLTSCVHKPVQSIPEVEPEYGFGYRPLPQEFLDWWFENLEDIRSGKIDVIRWTGDTKLIVNSQDIAETQEVLTAPELSALPSYYVALHTEPKNQNPNNTCWAFATVGSLESALLTQLSYSERSELFPFLDDPDNPDLSEQFMAYYNINFTTQKVESRWGVTCQETNKDIGGDLFFSSSYNLIRRGVPPENVFPYDTSKQYWIKWTAVDNSWKTKLVRSNGTVVIPPYYWFGDYQTYINTIKSAIVKYGALAVAFRVYNDFMGYFWRWDPYKGKVYVSNGVPTLEGHAVLLVGWVDSYYDSVSGYSGPVWILKNSWGTDGGFSLADYDVSSDTTGGYFALPMITSNELTNKTCPDWKIEASGMYVPIVETEQRFLRVLADHEEHTVGRVSYITVNVVDENDQPVSNVRVRMLYKGSDEQWYPVTDVLTGQDTFTTDSNGIAKAAVLPNVEFVDQEFYAYIVEDPFVNVDFTVTFRKPSWLFMIWMCADNDLEQFAVSDLTEIMNNNSNVAVITFVDGWQTLTDSVRVLDEFGNFQTIHVFDDDFDSGDYVALAGYVGVFKSLIEASNYALVIWDHGNAWIYDYKANSSYSPQAIAFDYTSGNRITTPELRIALEMIGKINLLAMDACLMGSFEVLYELKGLVDYVVASAFSVPGTGFDYDFLSEISNLDDAVNVGEKIVDAYRNFYDGNTYWENMGLSLALYNMNTSTVTLVANLVSDLGYELVTKMNSDLRNVIHQFYPSVVNYEYTILVDVNDCMEKMKSNIQDATIQNLAAQVQSSLNNLVIYEYAEKSGTIIQNPVSIFMPNSADIVYEFANDYNTLLFPGHTFWSDFLESWLETGDVLEWVELKEGPAEAPSTSFIENSLLFRQQPR